MHRKLIAAVIEIIRGEMVRDGEADSFEDINNGHCEEFAERVVDMVVSQAADGKAPDIEPFEMPNFFQVDPSTGFAYDNGGPLDRDLLLRVLPSMLPPGGISWDEFDSLLSSTGIGWGTHVFMVCDGRVYDSEAPHGVDSMFELPFFERFMATWKANNASEPAPIRRA